MQVDVAFSDRSINEVRKSGLTWLLIAYDIVSEFLPVLVIFSFPVAAVANLVREAQNPAPEWSSAAGLPIVSLIPATLVIWRFRRRQQRRRRKVTAGYPQLLTLDTSGIQTREHGGRRLFAGWQYYSGFKEGESVFLLRLARRGGYRAIPFDRLSIEAKGQLRAILLSHLPEL
jgi:hypothetical protein